jgi:predicted phage-related endonuclease
MSLQNQLESGFDLDTEKNAEERYKKGIFAMELLAREYKEIKAQIDAMEAQAETLKQEMIKGMDETKAEKLTAGAFKISYTIYESARFDSTKFKADHADLYSEYSKKTASTRFQVA